MGVPAFYRWLSEKYPKIVTDVLEQRPFAIEGHPLLLPDAREPNPSGLETDNFYIDLNGVIHPCRYARSQGFRLIYWICVWYKDLMNIFCFFFFEISFLLNFLSYARILN